jgi:Tol biopolymer transport system component
LKKVSVRGGGSIVLADAVALGAAWGRDDSIVFSRQTDHGIALFTIAASGGAARQLTTPANDRIRVGWPSYMPDGNMLLFSETDQPSFGGGRIAALSLRTGERRVVLERGYAGHYAESGHLVYLLDAGVMAIRFDPNRMQTLGAPVQVISTVLTDRINGWSGMSVATTGALLYDEGLGTSERSLEWVNRDRTEAPVVNDRGEYSYPRLSPDGRRLAVGVGFDIWVLDLVRGTRVRIAGTDRGTSPPPPITAWTADGRRLAISRRSAPEGQLDLVDPDDLEHATPLLRRPYLVQLGSWSRNGTLAFFQLPGGSERDVWLLEPGAHEPRPFLVSRFNERGATFSPDGRWLGYAADPTGRDEVYIRAYPGPGPQIPVSTEGGVEPAWSRDGQEIFYREGDRMMAVPFGPGPTPVLGRPRVIFERPYAASSLGVANYDVGPDGRFVVVRPINTIRDNRLTVVLNWTEDLKRLVPTK